MNLIERWAEHMQLGPVSNNRSLALTLDRVRELLAESLRGYRLRQSLQAAHAELGAAARQSGWLTEDDILQDAS